MITYYELLKDGTIGVSTEDQAVAEDIGLVLTTEREIVYGFDGKRYFKGDEPVRPPQVPDYDTALEQHLLDERTAKGYTTREPTAYANSTNARWRQDSADWSAHVDAVMEYALEVENRVAAGEPAPTVDEFKAALPKIVWTYGKV